MQTAESASTRMLVQPAFPITDPTAEPPSPAPASAGRGLILVADDDKTFRDTLMLLLRHKGYSCLAAADAEEALALLQGRPIDALVADIRMPGNWALELVEEASVLTRGLPILLLTGEPSFETAARSVRLGVVAYLQKPPNMQELFDVLQGSIRQRRRLKSVIHSREHAEKWVAELSAIEASLERPTTDHQAAGDYLRVTLAHIALQIAELARATAGAGDASCSAANLENAQLVQALRDTITVLEKTRKSFKSKELGELRRRLSTLVSPRHDDRGEEQEFPSCR